MSDIVERLRDQRYIGQEGMRAEAAAEIERLRKKLLDIGADRQQAAMERDDPIGDALRSAKRDREEMEKNWLDHGSYGKK